MAALPLLLLLIFTALPSPDLTLKVDRSEAEKKYQDLKNRFQSLGYLKMKINQDFEDNSVILKVYLGPRYRIEGIEIEKSPLHSHLLYDDIGLTEGSFYSKSEIEKGIERILKRHLNHGFPFCSIRPQLVEISDNRLILRIEVSSGPMIKISDLIYNGKTKDWAVKRWIRFSPGIFNQQKINYWMSNLKKLYYIKDIEEKIIHSGSDYLLLFNGKEIRSEFFETGGSYEPNGGDYLIIFNLVIDNIFGTMRKISLNWESNRRLEFFYLEPWLIFPLRLELRLNDVWYDSLRVGRGEIGFSSENYKVYTGLERGDRSDEFIGL